MLCLFARAVCCHRSNNEVEQVYLEYQETELAVEICVGSSHGCVRWSRPTFNTTSGDKSRSGFSPPWSCRPASSVRLCPAEQEVVETKPWGPSHVPGCLGAVWAVLSRCVAS